MPHNHQNTRGELKGTITKASEFFSHGDVAMAVLKRGLKDILIVGDNEGQPAYLFGDYEMLSDYILKQNDITYDAVHYDQFNLSIADVHNPTQAQEKLLLFAPKIKIFQKLQEDRILRLTKNVQFVRYKKDEVIFNQGETTKEIYVILSGSIALYNDNYLRSIDKNRYLTTLVQGAVLGEIAPFTGEPRSAKAIAASDQCMLLKFELNTERGIESDLLLVYKNALELIADKLKQSNTKHTTH